MGLVDTFYEAAAGDVSWDEVGRQLGEEMSSEPADIMHRSKDAKLLVDGDRQLTFGTTSVPPELVVDYVLGFEARDPLKPRAMLVPPGRAWTVPMLLPVEQWRRSPFFNEWAIRAKSVHMLGATWELQEGGTVAFCFRRGLQGEQFSRSDMQRVEEVMVHLGRAADLGIRLTEARAAADVAWATLDLVSDAMFALDRQGRIVRANEAGERLRREGVVRSPTPGDGPPGARPPMRTRHEDAIFTWVFRNAPPRLSRSRIAALLFVTSERDTSVPAHRWLRVRFGLSPAEMSLVLSLVAGATLQEIADLRAVELTTVRTQLRSVLRKTETSRQSTLVAKVLLAFPRLRSELE